MLYGLFNYAMNSSADCSAGYVRKFGKKYMEPRAKKFTIAMVIAIFFLFNFFLGKNFLIYVDNRLLNENLRQIYGRHIEHENWLNLPHLPKNMNYQWMDRGQKPIRIAHALGFAGTSLANRIEALPQTRRQHFDILEVDLWLADDKSVRCHHGPDSPGPLLETTCTFDRLLRATKVSGEYLVLDIKTDFALTSKAIVATMHEFPMDRRRIIFQLYKPDDIRTFSQFKNLKDYAGPIVTAYTSRASLNDIAKGAKHAGIRAVTIPMERQAALNRALTKSLRVYVHPIHSCLDLYQAQKNKYDGIYTLSMLQCKFAKPSV